MINFAVIGTNFITDRLLKAAEHCAGFQLYGVYSRTAQRAKEYAARYGAPKTYTTLEELAADENVDAVYIASPTFLHASQSLQMLNAGKHVLCEKPIASNTSELKKMLEAAQKNNKVLLEAMRPVFTPGMKAVEEGMKKIGTVRRVHFTYCQYSSRYDKFKEGIVENAFKPELSNGAIMDIGTYCIYAASYLFGKPKEIKAVGVQLESSIDGTGSVLADYGDFLAELVYSKITNSYQVSEIQGEKGCMIIPHINIPEEVKIRYYTGEEECLFAEGLQDDMQYELNRFMGFMNDKEEKEIKIYHEASLNTMWMIDEARRQLGIKFPADLN
ncbi:Gfo/Idh/MocA family protein [Robinsoniella peoriensis]|uniref:Gfo/Idh/MocA family protein n=1 Tax=Robinsoniella peoriensis TaxID=180332 RepID=UPI00085BC540|nr:Gfo/Idh/MocA family oxidoreductase [Robinsoniella peoriensis]